MFYPHIFKLQVITYTMFGKDNTKKTLSNAVVLVSAYAVSTRLLAFFFKIYLSRSLGAEVVGLYQMCLSMFFLLVSFAASGIPVVLSRKIAEDTAIGSNKSNKYLSSAMIISAIIATVIAVVFYVFNKPLTKIFADPRAMPMFLLMLPALFTTCIYNSVRGWFWGMRDFNSFSLAELTEEVFRIFFGVLLIAGCTAWLTDNEAVALSFAISDFACAATLIFIFFKKKGKLEKPTGYKTLLKSSVPITAMRTCGGLITTLTALILPLMLVAVGGLTMSEATATFGRVTGMAMPLLMAPTTLTSALSIVLIPEIAASNTKEDKSELNRRVNNSILFSVVVSAFFCILYIPLGKEVTEIVFSDRFAGEYLSYAAVLLFPIGLNQVTLSMLNSLGLEKETFKNYIVGTVLLLASLFLLPKYVGVYSVAIGTGLCFTLSTILNLRLLKRHVKLTDDLKKPFLAVALMPVCCAIAYLLKWLLMPIMPELLAVILAGGIPMSLYVAFAVAYDIISFARFRFIKVWLKKATHFWKKA